MHGTRISNELPVLIWFFCNSKLNTRHILSHFQLWTQTHFDKLVKKCIGYQKINRSVKWQSCSKSTIWNLRNLKYLMYRMIVYCPSFKWKKLSFTTRQSYKVTTWKLLEHPPAEKWLVVGEIGSDFFHNETWNLVRPVSDCSTHKHRALPAPASHCSSLLPDRHSFCGALFQGAAIPCSGNTRHSVVLQQALIPH